MSVAGPLVWADRRDRLTAMLCLDWELLFVNEEDPELRTLEAICLAQQQGRDRVPRFRVV